MLYLLFAVMFIVAIGIFLIAFARHQISKKSLICLTVMIMIFSVFVYRGIGDKAGLQLWLAQGKQHYQLLEKFNELGGVDGAIVLIEKKLKANPNDKQGWLILAKLYLAKQDPENARKALARAKE